MVLWMKASKWTLLRRSAIEMKQSLHQLSSVWRPEASEGLGTSGGLRHLKAWDVKYMPNFRETCLLLGDSTSWKNQPPLQSSGQFHAEPCLTMVSGCGMIFDEDKSCDITVTSSLFGV